MSFNLGFARGGLFSALMTALTNRKGESDNGSGASGAVGAAIPDGSRRPAMNRLRAVNNEAQKRFVFFDRLKGELQAKSNDDVDFGKVTHVNIEAVATTNGADSGVKSEKSMTRARVTSHRLTALQGYLDESA